MTLLYQILAGPTGGMSWGASVLLLGARVYAGVTIASAGLDKLPTPDWMADQVAQIGFPAPALFATVACLTEFIAGLLLALGLFTRSAAFLLAFTMGVASFGFHRVDFFTIHVALEFFWLFVAFLAVGGGRLSLDHGVSRLRERGSRGALGVALAPVVVAVGTGLYLELRTPPPPPAVEEPGDVVIESVSLAGSFNAWEVGEIALESSGDGVWRVTRSFDEPGAIEFKFVANGSWETSVGDADQEGTGCPVAGFGESDGGNIVAYVPRAGDYVFEIDAGSYGYRFGPVEPAAE